VFDNLKTEGPMNKIDTSYGGGTRYTAGISPPINHKTYQKGGSYEI